jgi:hypothetical protein
VPMRLDAPPTRMKPAIKFIEISFPIRTLPWADQCAKLNSPILEPIREVVRLIECTVRLQDTLV